MFPVVFAWSVSNSLSLHWRMTINYMTDVLKKVVPTYQHRQPLQRRLSYGMPAHMYPSIFASHSNIYAMSERLPASHLACQYVMTAGNRLRPRLTAPKMDTAAARTAPSCRSRQRDQWHPRDTAQPAQTKDLSWSRQEDRLLLGTRRSMPRMLSQDRAAGAKFGASRYCVRTPLELFPVGIDE